MTLLTYWHEHNYLKFLTTDTRMRFRQFYKRSRDRNQVSGLWGCDFVCKRANQKPQLSNLIPALTLLFEASCKHSLLTGKHLLVVPRCLHFGISRCLSLRDTRISYLECVVDRLVGHLLCGDPSLECGFSKPLEKLHLFIWLLLISSSPQLVLQFCTKQSSRPLSMGSESQSNLEARVHHADGLKFYRPLITNIQDIKILEQILPSIYNSSLE